MLIWKSSFDLDKIETKRKTVRNKKEPGTLKPGALIEITDPEAFALYTHVIKLQSYHAKRKKGRDKPTN